MLNGVVIVLGAGLIILGLLYGNEKRKRKVLELEQQIGAEQEEINKLKLEAARTGENFEKLRNDFYARIGRKPPSK